MYIGQCGGVSGQTKSLETGEWGLHLGSLEPSMSSPTLLAVLLQTSYIFPLCSSPSAKRVTFQGCGEGWLS